MSNLLREDAKHRPDLFIWNGPIPAERLDQWLRQRQFCVPTDLTQLWLETGGGDFFESETILNPIGVSGDDLDSVNEAYYQRGLPRDYLLVHVGTVLTAIRLHDQKWIVLDESYDAREEYSSLDDWYASVLRSEFADRYGLP